MIKKILRIKRGKKRGGGVCLKNIMHKKSSEKNQITSPAVVIRRLDISKTSCWAFHATYRFRAKTEYYA